MASAIIHICVAKEIEKNLKIKNLKDYYLGSIAPDIAKQIGRSKKESHFLYNEKDQVPNIDMFIKEYPDYKNNDFDLGYFIHLYTDKLWFDGFIDTLTYNSSIKLLDGTILNLDTEEIDNLIYNDYTNLNVQLIDEYNLDLSLFYEDFVIPNSKIKEIPIDKLNILIDKMSIIIENSKEEKAYLFDISNIKEFIIKAKEEIFDFLKGDNK